jgi:hypothetical protein
MPLLNINKYGVAVGQTDRITHEGAKPFRDAYKTATPEQRAQLEREFITGYIEGNLDRTPQQAQAIYNNSRTKRSNTEQASYKRGYAKYNYHVKVEVRKQETMPKFNARMESAPKDIVDSVLDIIIESGMTKAQFNSLISKVRASVTFK